MGEKKDRYEDALNATRAAVEEGILPGGGTALIKATKILDEVKEKPLISIKIGVDTIRAAITKPAKRIIENAGEEGAVIVGKIYDEPEFNKGYDSQKGEFTDMIAAGIIDPFKVVKNGLVDALVLLHYWPLPNVPLLMLHNQVHQLLHQLQVWEVCQVCSR